MKARFKRNKLIDYALEKITRSELNYYCQHKYKEKGPITIKDRINLEVLKDHLIGKVGCNEKKVLRLYKLNFPKGGGIDD